MERERRREAEWGDTEGKDEEFRMGGGGCTGRHRPTRIDLCYLTTVIILSLWGLAPHFTYY